MSETQDRGKDVRSSWIRRGMRAGGRLPLLAALAAVLALGLAACGGDDDDDSGETTAAEEGVILLVPHKVESYDRWKPVFLDHRDVREQYGGSRDLVYRDLDAPDTQHVTYNTFPNEEEIDAFLEDPSLAEAMTRAGVQPPLPPPAEVVRELEVVDYENPDSGVAGDEENSVMLVIRHDVEDFESWKPVFDEVEEIRREHGATGHRLFASVDDPNDVFVYESYPDRQSALAFFNDPRLADAMERAGVKEGTINQTLRTLDINEEY